MKTSLKALIFGLLVLAQYGIGHWVTAQGGPQKPRSLDPTNIDYALEELTSFLTYLEEAKLTNVSQRFGEYENASIISKESADIGMIAHALVDLRKGRTNDAIELLEIEMEGNAIGFAASYRELPDRIREKVSLQPLRDIRYYSTNYQFLRSDPELLDGITNALKLIDAPLAR